MVRSKKGRDSETATFQDDESPLEKAFKDYSNNETTGILNAIGEAMQELETKKQALDLDFTEGEEELFEAAEEHPRSFGIERDEITSPTAGPLMTNEEVAHALRREETGQSLKDNHGLATPNDMKNGIRSRFRGKSQAKKNKGKDEQEMIAGIFGTTNKPHKWSLSHYLQSVASTREKRAVAVSAWVLALIGLIISLVFVSIDFIDSRKEMASTVQYVEASRLELPSIWLCTKDTELPHFVDLPTNQYPGQPFLWIDFFRGSRSKANVTYPNTKELPQLDVISVNILGQSCGTQKVMNPEVFERENTMPPKCFQCFSISRRPAIELDEGTRTDDRGLQSLGGSEKHATFRISRHSIMSKCRTSQYGLSRDIFSFFTWQIKEQAGVLKDKGILDFGVFDPKSSLYDQYLWPLYRMGYGNTTVDFAVFDVVDMFCNVYMFSGHFYPSSAKSVNFKFNDVYYRWERAGSGPYYPRRFEEFYSGSSSTASLYSMNEQIGAERYENKSMFIAQAVQVMTNHSRLEGVEMLATLEPSNMASVRLSRNMLHNRESYQANVFRTTIEKGDVRAVNFVYYLDLSFESFLTRVVSDQVRVSWPAFIADFFGLTSLFLDVSVYTLIVSPLIMRARKKALMARKLNTKGPNLV